MPKTNFLPDGDVDGGRRQDKRDEEGSVLGSSACIKHPSHRRAPIDKHFFLPLRPMLNDFPGGNLPCGF